MGGSGGRVWGVGAGIAINSCCNSVGVHTVCMACAQSLLSEHLYLATRHQNSQQLQFTVAPFQRCFLEGL